MCFTQKYAKWKSHVNPFVKEIFSNQLNAERTLKNEEKLEEVREKVNNSNCTESVSRQVYITPVVGMQNDEENPENLEIQSNHVVALDEDAVTRMKSLEGQVQNLHSKLDSRLNSQEDFEGNLPKLLFFFAIIVRENNGTLAFC